jgi:hypothetical protein
VATASVRRRFGLEAASAALAGNGCHGIDHRSVSPERAAIIRLRADRDEVPRPALFATASCPAGVAGEPLVEFRLALCVLG